MCHKVLDLGNQFLDAAEGPPADSALGNDVEPDLHLVEP